MAITKCKSKTRVTSSYKRYDKNMRLDRILSLLLMGKIW